MNASSLPLTGDGSANGPHSPPCARIGLVYNPRSHRNKGRDLDLGGREDVVVATPQTRGQIADVLRDFAKRGIEYLVINGGDGTVRDVLTCGHAVFGDDWPVLAIVPKGKTNALTVDLGARADASLAETIGALEGGRRIARRPLQITRLDGEGEALLGFILGAGAYTIGVRAGQGAHRLGLFNSLAVGMTTGWSIMQIVFGRDSNPWRRGVAMDLRLLPGGEPVPRSQFGDPARREIMLASTLHRMPMGMKPFGPERGGLKLAVMDHPRRRLMASLPLIVAGWQPDWLASSGLHQLDAEAFAMSVGDAFILDGEAFGPGSYLVAQGPEIAFVVA